MTLYASHPKCASKRIDWPEMLIPGDLRCRRCNGDLDPSDQACDASVALGKPHHMTCPT